VLRAAPAKAQEGMEGMDGAKLILEVTGDTVRANSLRSLSGRFRLDRRKHSSP